MASRRWRIVRVLFMHGPEPEVERHRVRDLELVASFRRVKARESSRLATLGVVRARGARLREELEEADEEDDLPLARLRDLVPKLGRRLGGVVARDVDGELYAVGVEACGNQPVCRVDGERDIKFDFHTDSNSSRRSRPSRRGRA